MYETFFGFRERPFSLLPDPQFLFESAQHRAALAQLLLAVENQSSISVLTGAPGTGKTTLLRELMRHMPSGVTVGLITNTHESFAELLHWILSAFLIPCDQSGRCGQTGRMDTLREFLKSQKAEGQRALLILDEAQNLSPDAIEELRVLADIGADGTPAIQIMLAGQPELSKRLARADFASFTQRIGLHCEIGTLSAEDTAAYIAHRTSVAGATRPVFEPRACAAIHRHTAGNPRLINLLCDLSLVYGFANDSNAIDAQIVENVLRERSRNGSIPAFHDTVVLSARNDEPQLAQMRVGEKGESPAMLIRRKRKTDAQLPFGIQAKAAPASGPESSRIVAHPDKNKVQSRTDNSGESANMEPASNSPFRAKPALRARRPDSLLAAERLSVNQIVIRAFFAGVIAAGLVAGGIYIGLGSALQTPEAARNSQSSTVAPVMPGDSASTPQAMAEVARLKAELLVRERDAATEKARALERERDAVVAAARAETRARNAKSETVRARMEKEHAAKLAAQAHEETARTLDQLRASQEQAALTAARERAAAERATHALEHVPPPVAGQSIPASAPPVVPEPMGEAAAAPANTEAPSGFSANPCKGPSARFLSTCKGR